MVRIAEIPDGFELIQYLTDHTDYIKRIIWSPDGTYIASSSADNTVRIWSADDGKELAILSKHTDVVYGLAWSPDGTKLASASKDTSIILWDIPGQAAYQRLHYHQDWVMAVAWSPDGQLLASGSQDRNIALWYMPPSYDVPKRNPRNLSHAGTVEQLAWSPDGTKLVSCSRDGYVIVWNVKSSDAIKRFRHHTDGVLCVTWSPDGKMLASCGEDMTIKIWDLENGTDAAAILEGHHDSVTSISISADGRFLASKSRDNRIFIWNLESSQHIATLSEPHSPRFTSSLAFHPSNPHLLATLDRSEFAIRIWKIDYTKLFVSFASSENSIAGQQSSSKVASRPGLRNYSRSYRNAKIVLVGDSGVGKSALGLRLTDQDFTATTSTHGRHVWTFEDRAETLLDGSSEQHEILLWDLAGQPGYRIIHQMHLSEVAIALICIDAQSETDPFSSVRYWHKALEQAQKARGNATLSLKKYLVATRVDRGGIPVSQERIESLRHELGIAGYFVTSAKDAIGIDELRQAIHTGIDWDSLPKVSSTTLFVSIKDFLIAEKEQGRVLATVDDLYRTFLNSTYAPENTDDVLAEFETVIGRVESRDLIRRLSFGNFVLLQPELLDAYASAIVFEAREEPDGLGSIREELVRSGHFRMSDDERLPNKELEKLLLIATIEDLIRFEIALSDEGYLIFPSQMTRERADLPDPEGKAVVFTFEGATQNIYTRLAVRLARSGVFRRDGMWRNAVTFTALRGTCGMWLRERDEGVGELTLFYSPEASEETRFHFEQYVENEINRRAIPNSVTRRRIFVCPNCGVALSDQIVRARRERNFDFVICPVCDTRISLHDREERLQSDVTIIEMDRNADKARDLATARFTISGKEATDDFDVFLSHRGADKPQIIQIANRLRERGLLPWLDMSELPIGRTFPKKLEEGLQKSKTLAFFVGAHEVGPWQQRELDAFMELDRPIIPVFLPTAPVDAELSLLLKMYNWVDFRQTSPDPLERLIEGITGEKSR